MFHTSARTKAVACAIAIALVVATGSALPRLTSGLPRAHAATVASSGERRHPTLLPHQPARRATSRSTPRRHFTGTLRVAYFGDSLAHEAADHFTARLLGTRRAEVHAATYGGTAICDWFDRMRTEAATWRPQVAVVEFSGNALTPCMQDSRGVALRGASYAGKYRADADTVLGIFSAVGAEVYFAGAPVSRLQAEDPDYHGGAINAVYRAVARAHPDHARFVDAGAAVLDHGHWTATLPCTEHEPCGADGRNVVRAPDGAHFCPTSGEARRGVTGTCAVWSSGAYRYGLAMAAPVVHDFSL